MQANQHISIERLSHYRGQWVACVFEDGQEKVVASAKKLIDLKESALNAGEDPNKVVLTFVPDENDDAVLGGIELQ